MMKYYIGLSLSPSATIETGVAVLDQNNNFILVDKFFTMKDVEYFFENYSSLKYSKICVSLPWDNTLMNGKWRILSKPYQMLNTTNKQKFINVDNWTQRFSTRGCDYFQDLVNRDIDISRYDLYLSRLKLNLYSNFKQRSPADCKFLQNVLKSEFGFVDIPTNMLPAGVLEAMVGALVAREQGENNNVEKLYEFKGLDVINVKDENLIHKFPLNPQA